MTSPGQVDARGPAPALDRSGPAGSSFGKVNGSLAHAAHPITDRVRAVFQPLWAGHTKHLDDVPMRTVPPLHDNVAAADRPAVLAALRTPDVCLIETPNPQRALQIAAAVAAAVHHAGETVVVHASSPDIARGLETLTAGLARIPAPPTKRSWWNPATWLAASPRAAAPVLIVLKSADHPELTRDCVLVLNSHGLHWDEILAAAALGRRWVFIGETAVESDFARLWSALDRGRWAREGDRLCCRLCAVEPQLRHRLTAEPLADAPDIELRIDQPPGEDPRLAEVVFPAGTTLAAAKEFIGRTLDEWPIDVDPAALVWSENESAVQACLGCSQRHQPLTAEISPGVRELIAERPGQPVPWFTCGFTFDRAAGWDRPRAESWLRERLAGRPVGRAVSVLA